MSSNDSKFNGDTGLWEILVEGADGRFLFEVAGDKTGPNSDVFSHVQKIRSSFSEFSASVKQFLEKEARVKPGAAHEINKLKIESVVLCWPNKPDSGLIYFKGPDENRLWRCDYINGKLASLTFDN